ncbi:hypothetical protein G4Y79_05220 [Phototrophicus methaneseepsis]|uniref:Uncharacterized protein n=1 Tax=Phototrophicus methaneseepsis TaxID=2710758 RepID=A0A7S8EB93_9CHLR|nr:hypothetical protein [Phototrophicus methaneseepsis]QPC83781.1 hypothetical protein G4Y79_05220 [Phototrophicus methaneseepsis]
MKVEHAPWYRLQKNIIASTYIPGIRRVNQRRWAGDLVPDQWFAQCQPYEFDYLLLSEEQQGAGVMVPTDPTPDELEVLYLLFPAAFDVPPQAGDKQYARANWIKVHQSFYLPTTIDGIGMQGDLVEAPENGFRIVPGRYLEAIGDTAYMLAQTSRWGLFEETTLPTQRQQELLQIWPTALGESSLGESSSDSVTAFEAAQPESEELLSEDGSDV